jgi:hypothetical protein
MSPYGSIVGTVATTTMSPVAASSVRIIRSIVLALSASTTLAKSLTGAVRSGRRSAARADDGARRNTTIATATRWLMADG